MKRAFKREKARKDWKTSVVSIAAFVLIGLALIFPDKFTSETQSTILANLDMILAGAGALVQVIIGVFAATDE